MTANDFEAVRAHLQVMDTTAVLDQPARIAVSVEVNLVEERVAQVTDVAARPYYAPLLTLETIL